MKKCLSFLFRVEKHINMNYSIISDGIYTTHKKLRILNILNFFVYLIYAIRARIAYTNYTKS